MPKRKRNFRWVKWLLVFVLIAVAAVTTVLVKNNFDKKSDEGAHRVAEKGETDDQELEGETKQRAEGKEEEASGLKEKVPQYEGESPNKSETLTGLITYVGVVNDELAIRVNIDQFLQTGNCKLNIIKDSRNIYNSTVSIQESVTTSTCDGFNIPVAQLVSGNLQVEIILESDGRSGKIIGEAYV